MFSKTVVYARVISGSHDCAQVFCYTRIYFYMFIIVSYDQFPTLCHDHVSGSEIPPRDSVLGWASHSVRPSGHSQHPLSL